MSELMSDNEIIDRVFEHIDNETTDLGDDMWSEPVRNYTCPDRFKAEIDLMRRLPIVYCPSAALPEVGSYVARTAAHTPLVAVRGEDGIVRTFRNACRHRGAQVAHGTGRKLVFVCDYHAWSYGLDGSLRHIPHEKGFPDVEKRNYGLVPVKTEERGGLVFVTQEEPIGPGALESLPTMLETRESHGYEPSLVAVMKKHANAEGKFEEAEVRSIVYDLSFSSPYLQKSTAKPFSLTL